MRTARHWHGGQLLAVWLLASTAFVLVRRVLVWGTYQAQIEGHRETIVSGLWPEPFASAMTVVTGAICVVTLAWLTATWIAGRKARERVEAMTENPYRRPLL